MRALRQRLRAAIGLPLVAVAAAALAPPAPAQGPAAGTESEQLARTVRVWRTDEGLPNNRVSALAQTPDGFLWAGTFNGLARFDGVAFEVFDHTNTPGLPDSRVERLHVDGGGRLWLALAGGAVGHLGTGGFFTLTAPDDASTPGRGAPVSDLFGDPRRGRLLVGTRGAGLHELRGGRTTPSTLAPGLRADHPAAAVLGCTDRDGMLWLGDAQGFGPVEPAGWRRVWQFPAPIDLDRDEPEFQALTPSARGGVWTAADRRFRRWHEGAWAEDLGEFPWVGDAQVNVLLEDRDGGLWAGTGGRGAIYYHDVRNADDYTVELAGMPSDDVLSLLQDREGNIWVGTDGGGLVRLRHKQVRPFGAGQALDLPEVTAVAEDGSEDLWLGTADEGLWLYEWPRLEPVGGVSARRIETVLAGRGGTAIWVGTAGGGLFRVDPDSHQSTEIGGLEERSVYALHEDADGTLWAGCDDGLYHLAPGAGAAERFRSPGQPGEDAGGTGAEPPPRDILAVTRAPTGDLWAGTRGGGLYRLHPGGFTRYTRATGLADDVVGCLWASPDGTVWAGTTGGGLSRWTGRGFESFGPAEGLPDTVVTAVLPGTGGRVWVGTHRGVFRFRPPPAGTAGGRLRGKRFGRDLGLTHTECNGGHQPSALRRKSGTLLFPTRGGLYEIDPAKVPANPVAPETVIDRVEAGGQTVFAYHPWRRGDAAPGEGAEGRPGGATLTLAAGTANVTVAFTAAGLTAPEEVRFRYRLLGADGGWAEAAPGRSVAFRSLPPGAYRLEAVASNEDGLSDPTPAVAAFSIAPHPWQTGGFRAVFALLLAGLVAWGARAVALRKMARRMEQVERAHAVEQERARIARDMHDDLGARLTQITLLGELAKGGGPGGENDLPPAAAGRIDQITRTARETAAALDELVWAVNPRNDTLERLVSYLVTYAVDYCRSTGMECRADAPAGLPATPIPGEFRHHLFLAVQEALNNAAKHAGARAVDLSVEIPDGAALLRVTVADDGRGFDPAGADESGNGLVNLRRRLEDLRGKVDIASAPGQGCRVIFEAPLTAGAPPLPHDPAGG